MTQTPGTQSYMPPEALRPNPHYDIEVDVFSFGVMLVHVLCGQWPIPTEPTRVDPCNPAHVIGLTEVERRQSIWMSLVVPLPRMKATHLCL